MEVEDGVATRIESNYDIGEEHPGCGRICVRAYGLIQKTYNPNRISQPMKRTNPKKGREHDPGFTPITWDDALTIVAEKMREIRGKGLRDESGAPRLAVRTGGGGTPVQYMGTLPAFMAAWGPPAWRDAYLLIPLPHAVEMIRAGVFGPFVETHYDGFYAFGWGLVLNLLGLLLIAGARDRIEAE